MGTKNIITESFNCRYSTLTPEDIEEEFPNKFFDSLSKSPKGKMYELYIDNIGFLMNVNDDNIITHIYIDEHDDDWTDSLILNTFKQLNQFIELLNSNAISFNFIILVQALNSIGDFQFKKYMVNNDGVFESSGTVIFDKDFIKK